MTSAKQYLVNIKQALTVSLGNSNLYQGEQGALRLAREIGTCLQDYDKKEAYDAFRDSYNYVCVSAPGMGVISRVRVPSHEGRSSG